MNCAPTETCSSRQSPQRALSAHGTDHVVGHGKTLLRSVCNLALPAKILLPLKRSYSHNQYHYSPHHQHQQREARKSSSIIHSGLQSLCQSGGRESTRLNSSHLVISYAVFCLKKKKTPRRREKRESPARSRPHRGTA